MAAHVAALLLAPLCLLGQPAAPPAEGPSADQIARAVRQLGDDSYMVRQRASTFLWEAGQAAEKALREAVKSDDAEVVARARQILRRFKYGIYPNTPPQIVELIRQYRYGDMNRKRKVLKDLVDQGEVAAMLRLVGTESDPAVRDQLTSSLLGDAQKIVPQLILAGQRAQAEQIIELAASGSEGMRNYAAYLLLQGGLDDKITALKKELAGKSQPEGWRQLTYLLRARGDLDGALAAAEKAEVEPLVLGLLLEEGRWDKLAAHQKAEASKRSIQLSKPVESLGYLAAYERLAGNAAEADAAVKSILMLATKKPEQAWHCAEALLINHHVDESIVLLQKDHASTAFDLLVAQLRFRDALRLEGVEDPRDVNLPWMAGVADPLSGAGVQEREELTKKKLARFTGGLRTAGLLYRLGDQATARKLFDELAHAAGEDPKLKIAAVCEAEAEAGVPPLATHAMEAIAVDPAKEVLEAVYPEQAASALVWWEYAETTEGADDKKRYPETTAGADDKKRLAVADQSLLPPPKGLLTAERVRKAMDEAKGREPNQRVRWLVVLGEAARAQGWAALALECFEQAASIAPSPSRQALVGDLLAEQDRWRDAAGWYRRAWDENKTNPLPMYLEGRALLRAGDRKTGQQQMDLAVLMPLASGTTRYLLAKGLQERDLDQEASRQWDLIMRTEEPGEWAGNEAAKQRGNELSGQDNLRAAAYWERLLLSCLKSSTGTTRMQGYLKLLHLIHKARGRGLLAAGRGDEAMAEIELSRRALPGETRLAEDLVPELEKAGRKSSADDLFESVFTANRKVIEDFPRAATWLNNTAWLAAQCNRRLDEALDYATRATELQPDSAAYLDTLAEVHYRRGNRDEAARLARQCLEISPNEPHYKQQLARFEKGEP